MIRDENLRDERCAPWPALMGCWGGERAPRVFPTENAGAGFRPDGPRDIPQERPGRTKRAGPQKPETQRTRQSKTPDGITGTRATGDWPADRFFVASRKRRKSLGSGMMHYLSFVPAALRVLRIFLSWKRKHSKKMGAWSAGRSGIELFRYRNRPTRAGARERRIWGSPLWRLVPEK